MIVENNEPVEVEWKPPLDRRLSREDKVALLHESLVLIFSDQELLNLVGEVEVDLMLSRLENSPHLPEEAGDCWGRVAHAAKTVSEFYGG
jgi:hypothetical protein